MLKICELFEVDSKVGIYLAKAQMVNAVSNMSKMSL